MLPQFPLSLPATLRALTVERGKRTVKLEVLRLEQGPQTLKNVGTGSVAFTVQYGHSCWVSVGVETIL